MKFIRNACATDAGRIFAGCLLLLLLLAGRTGFAQTDLYWNGGNTTNNTNNTWNNTTLNWGTSTGATFAANTAPGVAWPTSGSYNANFTNTAAAATISLPAQISVTPQNTVMASGYGLRAAVTQTFASPLAITGQVTLGGATGTTLTMSGPISGSGTVSVSGSGTVELTGADTYAGLTNIVFGSLRLNHTGGGTLAPGSTVSLTASNGTSLQVSTDQTLANLTVPTGTTLTVDPGVTLTVTGTLTCNSGTINLGAGSTLLIGGTLFYNGSSITGSGTVKYGASGVLNYATSVVATAVEFPAANGPASVTVNGGASVNLNGLSRTIPGTLTLSSGATLNIGAGTLTLNGTFSGTGALTGTSASNLVTTASTTIYFSTTAQLNDWTISSGTVTLGNNSRPTINGTLTLTGNLTVGSGTLTLNGQPIAGNGNMTTSSSVSVLAFGGTATGMQIPSSVGGLRTLTINNPNGVTLNNNLAIGTLLTLSSGFLGIGNHIVIVFGALGSSGGTLRGGVGSKLTLEVGNTGGTLAMDQSTPGTTNLLQTLRTNGNTSSFVSLSGDLVLSDTLALNNFNETLIVGPNTLTLNGRLTGNSPSLVRTTSASSLVFGGNATGVSVPSSFTALGNLTINNPNGVTLSSSFIMSGALTLSSGYLALAGQGLTVNGGISGTGTLRGSAASALATSGTAALNFDQTTPGTTNALSFWQVTGGTSTLGSALQVYGYLDPSGGTMNLNGQSVTLKSTATVTARIAPVVGTLSGATNVTVERYIPQNATREWRLLSAKAVTGTQTINAAWQEGGSASSDPVPGFGTIITAGNATGYGIADGYDATAPNSSIYTYDPTANGNAGAFNITPSSTTNKALSSEQGYFLFVRGNRTSTPANGTITATTLRSNGTVTQGDQTYSNLADGTYQLIGNPYASAIDFSSIPAGNRTNIPARFWLWDPKVNTNGGYVLFDASTGTPYFPSITSGSYSAVNTVVPSGQAFFAQVSGGTGSLTIRENNKAVSMSNTGFRSNGTSQELRIALQTLVNGDTQSVDGAIALFNDDYSATVDGHDAGKPVNTNENLFLQRNATPLTLEARPAVQAADTLFLGLSKMKQKGYRLRIEPNRFTGNGTTAYLEDHYTGTQTALDWSSVSLYGFTVNGDSASAARDRFDIVFRQAATTGVASMSTSADWSAAPNPVAAGGVLTVRIPGAATGVYSMRLTDVNGRTVLTDRIRAGAGTATYQMQLPASVLKGVYQLQLGRPAGTISSQTILVR